jgi:hypothetical protein
MPASLLRLPPLPVEEVLRLAAEHRARTGAWPTPESGPVRGRPGLTWRRVDAALRHGRRGLPGGSSLALLLRDRLGKRVKAMLPPLTEAVILAWADAHRARTGAWPTVQSGPVADAPGETWANVNSSLHRGHRGLAAGDSLAKLLRRHGRADGLLSEALILRWADDYRRRHGRAPTAASGAVAGQGGRTWSSVDECLRRGCRGLPGGDTLSRLLRRHGRQ